MELPPYRFADHQRDFIPYLASVEIFDQGEQVDPAIGHDSGFR